MEFDDNYREKFAALAHEQWSSWMQYLFSQGEFMDVDGTWVMPAELVERWKSQMHTTYKEHMNEIDETIKDIADVEDELRDAENEVSSCEARLEVLQERLHDLKLVEKNAKQG